MKSRALPRSDTQLAPGQRRALWVLLLPGPLGAASSFLCLARGRRGSRRWSCRQTQASAVLVASHAPQAEARPQGRKGQVRKF